MDLNINSHSFQNIRIPLIWRERAIVQEPNKIMSVINIGDFLPNLEILRNRPAPGINFLLTWSGFQVMRFPRDLYEFNVRERTFTTQTLGLPDVQIDDFYIRVGTLVYPNLDGFEAAGRLQVTPDDVKVGVPMPFALFRLIDGRSRVTQD